MAKLHEILAVESDKEGFFKKAIPEMIALFKNKIEHFQGHQKTLKLLDESPEAEAAEKAEESVQYVTSSVPKELEYLQGVVSEYIDVIYQKDLANKEAKADIIIGEEIIAYDVPATTLLGLEAKLKSIRPIYDEIPTLPPGTEWELDPSFGKYVYKDKNANVTAKTKKTFDFKILTPATDKHPAQIEKWNIDVPVGYFTKTRWSSCLSVAQKSALLGRLDQLTQAIKQARQRANGQEVDSKSKIGSKLFAYLHKNL